MYTHCMVSVESNYSMLLCIHVEVANSQVHSGEKFIEGKGEREMG